MAKPNFYSHHRREALLNKFLTIIFLIMFVLGILLVVRGAQGQSVPCQPGDSTTTCVALLNQKALQLDQHTDNTDRNVSQINTSLKEIDGKLTRIETNEAWERGIWGALVCAISSGFFAVRFRNKKTTQTENALRV